jgi:hypothetical protein
MAKGFAAWGDSIRHKGRIARQDVAALRREVLVDGLSSLEEAEAVLAVDRAVAVAHSSWAPTLIAILTDFAVWGARPTGIIDPAMGAWLAERLLGPAASPRGGRVLAAIVHEADQVDEALLARIMAEAEPEMKLAA